MAFIRPYKPTDEEAVIHVFRDTAAPDLKAHDDPQVLHVGSFLWCRDYIFLTPEWCHVLDDGEGKAVGYVLCAPDTAAFVRRYRDEFWVVAAEHGVIPVDSTDAAESKGVAADFTKLVYDPEHMLHGSHPALVNDYPAHLHIDILSSHQSAGWGEKMINVLLEQLKDAGVQGVHLGMVADNHRAHKFYDRIGFVRFEGMTEKGEMGRQESSVYRVKKLL